MTENSENRHAPRFAHISPLQVKDLGSGQIYEARMFNFSDSGIYFESDIVFQKGANIYICIQNSPFSRSSGVLEYYNGKIMWRKNLKRSFFEYGYGIQLSSDSSQHNLESKPAKNTKDSRRHPRKPFCRTVTLRNHKGIFQGSAKNISSSGIFIATEEKLEVGQKLKLDLTMKGKTAKIIGQVVWLNQEGFGLKFKKIY